MKKTRILGIMVAVCLACLVATVAVLGVVSSKSANTPVIEQMIINDNGELVIVYEDGTETNVGKVVGKDGEKGDKGDDGNKGDTGADAVQPKFRVNDDGYWEVSSDNGATWSSLGVKATGDKGETGSDGADAVAPQVRINTTTNIWEVSYDEGATWTSLHVAAIGGDGLTPKLRINPTEDDTDPNYNMWEVSYDFGTTWTSLGVRATGDKGETGEAGSDGSDGSDGVGIVSVIKTKTQGVVDTYTITFTDGSTATFTVTNGADGEAAAEVIVKVWVDDDDVLWVRYYDATKVADDPEHATRDVAYGTIHSNVKGVTGVHSDQNGGYIITYTDGTWEIVHNPGQIYTLEVDTSDTTTTVNTITQNNVTVTIPEGTTVNSEVEGIAQLFLNVKFEGSGKGFDEGYVGLMDTDGDGEDDIEPVLEYNIWLEIDGNCVEGANDKEDVVLADGASFTVTIAIPEDVELVYPRVFHMNGEAIDAIDVQYNYIDRTMTFTTSSFSPYVIADVKDDEKDIVAVVTDENGVLQETSVWTCENGHEVLSDDEPYFCEECDDWAVFTDTGRKSPYFLRKADMTNLKLNEVWEDHTVVLIRDVTLVDDYAYVQYYDNGSSNPATLVLNGKTVSGMIYVGEDAYFTLLGQDPETDANNISFIRPYSNYYGWYYDYPAHLYVAEHIGDIPTEWISGYLEAPFYNLIWYKEGTDYITEIAHVGDDDEVTYEYHSFETLQQAIDAYDEDEEFIEINYVGFNRDDGINWLKEEDNVEVTKDINFDVNLCNFALGSVYVAKDKTLHLVGGTYYYRELYNEDYYPYEFYYDIYPHFEDDFYISTVLVGGSPDRMTEGMIMADPIVGYTDWSHEDEETGETVYDSYETYYGVNVVFAPYEYDDEIDFVNGSLYSYNVQDLMYAGDADSSTKYQEYGWLMADYSAIVEKSGDNGTYYEMIDFADLINKDDGTPYVTESLVGMYVGLDEFMSFARFANEEYSMGYTIEDLNDDYIDAIQLFVSLNLVPDGYNYYCIDSHIVVLKDSTFETYKADNIVAKREDIDLASVDFGGTPIVNKLDTFYYTTLRAAVRASDTTYVNYTGAILTNVDTIDMLKDDLSLNEYKVNLSRITAENAVIDDMIEMANSVEYDPDNEDFGYFADEEEFNEYMSLFIASLTSMKSPLDYSGYAESRHQHDVVFTNNRGDGETDPRMYVINLNGHSVRADAFYVCDGVTVALHEEQEGFADIDLNQYAPIVNSRRIYRGDYDVDDIRRWFVDSETYDGYFFAGSLYGEKDYYNEDWSYGDGDGCHYDACDLNGYIILTDELKDVKWTMVRATTAAYPIWIKEDTAFVKNVESEFSYRYGYDISEYELREIAMINGISYSELRYPHFDLDNELCYSDAISVIPFDHYDEGGNGEASIDLEITRDDFDSYTFYEYIYNSYLSIEEEDEEDYYSYEAITDDMYLLYVGTYLDKLTGENAISTTHIALDFDVPQTYDDMGGEIYLCSIRNSYDKDGNLLLAYDDEVVLVIDELNITNEETTYEYEGEEYLGYNDTYVRILNGTVVINPADNDDVNVEGVLSINGESYCYRSDDIIYSSARLYIFGGNYNRIPWGARHDSGSGSDRPYAHYDAEGKIAYGDNFVVYGGIFKGYADEDDWLCAEIDPYTFIGNKELLCITVDVEGVEEFDYDNDYVAYDGPAYYTYTVRTVTEGDRPSVTVMCYEVDATSNYESSITSLDETVYPVCVSDSQEKYCDHYYRELQGAIDHFTTDDGATIELAETYFEDDHHTEDTLVVDKNIKLDIESGCELDVEDLNVISGKTLTVTHGTMVVNGTSSYTTDATLFVGNLAEEETGDIKLRGGRYQTLDMEKFVDTNYYICEEYLEDKVTSKNTYIVYFRDDAIANGYTVAINKHAFRNLKETLDASKAYDTINFIADTYLTAEPTKTGDVYDASTFELDHRVQINLTETYEGDNLIHNLMAYNKQDTISLADGIVVRSDKNLVSYTSEIVAPATVSADINRNWFGNGGFTANTIDGGIYEISNGAEWVDNSNIIDFAKEYFQMFVDEELDEDETLSHDFLDAEYNKTPGEGEPNIVVTFTYATAEDLDSFGEDFDLLCQVIMYSQIAKFGTAGGENVVVQLSEGQDYDEANFEDDVVARVEKSIDNAPKSIWIDFYSASSEPVSRNMRIDVQCTETFEQRLTALFNAHFNDGLTESDEGYMTMETSSETGVDKQATIIFNLENESDALRTFKEFAKSFEDESGSATEQFKGQDVEFAVEYTDDSGESIFVESYMTTRSGNVVMTITFKAQKPVEEVEYDTVVYKFIFNYDVDLLDVLKFNYDETDMSWYVSDLDEIEDESNDTTIYRKEIEYRTGTLNDTGYQKAGDLFCGIGELLSTIDSEYWMGQKINETPDIGIYVYDVTEDTDAGINSFDSSALENAFYDDDICRNKSFIVTITDASRPHKTMIVYRFTCTTTPEYILNKALEGTLFAIDDNQFDEDGNPADTDDKEIWLKPIKWSNSSTAQTMVEALYDALDGAFIFDDSDYFLYQDYALDDDNALVMDYEGTTYNESSDIGSDILGTFTFKFECYFGNGDAYSLCATFERDDSLAAIVSEVFYNNYTQLSFIAGENPVTLDYDQITAIYHVHANKSDIVRGFVDWLILAFDGAGVTMEEYDKDSSEANYDYYVGNTKKTAEIEEDSFMGDFYTILHLSKGAEKFNLKLNFVCERELEDIFFDFDRENSAFYDYNIEEDDILTVKYGYYYDSELSANVERTAKDALDMLISDINSQKVNGNSYEVTAVTLYYDTFEQDDNEEDIWASIVDKKPKTVTIDNSLLTQATLDDAIASLPTDEQAMYHHFNGQMTVTYNGEEYTFDFVIQYRYPL